MPTFKVVSQADARSWHLHEFLKSNGRWRLIVFAGNTLEHDPAQRLISLGTKLEAPNSFIRRFTPKNASIDSMIECLLVHAAPRKAVEIFDFPLIFRPFSLIQGWDYSKITVDDSSYPGGEGHGYETCEIDKSVGCSIVVRPDQYVSWVGEVDDYDSIDLFFSGFMKVQIEANNQPVDMPNGLLDYTVQGKSAFSSSTEFDSRT